MASSSTTITHGDHNSRLAAITSEKVTQQQIEQHNVVLVSPDQSISGFTSVTQSTVTYSTEVKKQVILFKSSEDGGLTELKALLKNEFQQPNFNPTRLALLFCDSPRSCAYFCRTLQIEVDPIAVLNSMLIWQTQRSRTEKIKMRLSLFLSTQGSPCSAQTQLPALPNHTIDRVDQACQSSCSSTMSLDLKFLSRNGQYKLSFEFCIRAVKPLCSSLIKMMKTINQHSDKTLPLYSCFTTHSNAKLKGLLSALQKACTLYFNDEPLCAKSLKTMQSRTSIMANDSKSILNLYFLTEGLKLPAEPLMISLLLLEYMPNSQELQINLAKEHQFFDSHQRLIQMAFDEMNSSQEQHDITDEQTLALSVPLMLSGTNLLAVSHISDAPQTIALEQATASEVTREDKLTEKKLVDVSTQTHVSNATQTASTQTQTVKPDARSAQQKYRNVFQQSLTNNTLMEQIAADFTTILAFLLKYQFVNYAELQKIQRYPGAHITAENVRMWFIGMLSRSDETKCQRLYDTFVEYSNSNPIYGKEIQAALTSHLST